MNNKLRRIDVFLGLANIFVGLALLFAWLYVWILWNTGPNNKSLAARFIIDIGTILLIGQLTSLAIVIAIAIKGDLSRSLKAACICLVIFGMAPTLSFFCYRRYVSRRAETLYNVHERQFCFSALVALPPCETAKNKEFSKNRGNHKRQATRGRTALLTVSLSRHLSYDKQLLKWCGEYL